MKKKILSTEAAYLAGLLILAIGTALMERADFGVSMVVAPAYLFHLKLVERFPFFSFGMAEYMLQAVLIIILALIQRRFHRGYLLSFATAVLYGFLLDGAIALIALLPYAGMAFRVICYLLGMVMCSIGVAFLFETYISPEAYELFVKELSARFQIPLPRFKTFYDCLSCLISVLLSFAFFGLWHFEGVKLGTILCALLNGWLIGQISILLHRYFDFKDALPLRSFFEV